MFILIVAIVTFVVTIAVISSNKPYFHWEDLVPCIITTCVITAITAVICAMPCAVIKGGKPEANVAIAERHDRIITETIEYPLYPMTETAGEYLRKINNEEYVFLAENEKGQKTFYNRYIAYCSIVYTNETPKIVITKYDFAQFVPRFIFFNPFYDSITIYIPEGAIIT